MRPASSGTTGPNGSTAGGGIANQVSVGVNSGTTATTSNNTPSGQTNNTTANFLQFAETDSAHPGVYALAGGLKPNPSTTPYSIVYFAKSKSFVITIMQEPLGVNRLTAQQELQKDLGLDQASMCNLNYYLGTTESVSEQYSGINLGFSYCPGATQLP